MKRFLAVLSCMALCLSSVIFYSGCKKTRAIPKLSVDFIADLTADIKGATGLGIQKMPIGLSTKSAKKSAAGDSVAKSLFSPGFSANLKTANAAEAGDKNYLVKTSSSKLDTGNLLDKVTFTRKSTKPVYDENGNIVDTEVVTQEDIPAQVNKLYVAGDFTFIQFIPVLDEGDDRVKISEYHKDFYYERYASFGKSVGGVHLRPRPDVLDDDGVSVFDKANYDSNEMSQSFIIQNRSGNIYKMEGFNVLEIFPDYIQIQRMDGYTYDRESLCTCRVDENNQLVIEELVLNPKFRAHGAFRGADGWLYIKANFDEVDQERHRFYFSSKYTRDGSGDDDDTNYYAYDENKQVYRIDRWNEMISGIVNNGVVSGYIPTGTIRGLKHMIFRGSSRWRPMILANDEFAYYNGVRISKYGADNLNFDKVQGYGGCFWLDNQYDRLIMSRGSGLYYLQVDPSNFGTSPIDVVESDLVQIPNSENLEKATKPPKEYGYDGEVSYNREAYLINNECAVQIPNLYIKETATDTKRYTLQRKEDGGVEMVLIDENYHQNNTIYLQPLNI